MTISLYWRGEMIRLACASVWMLALGLLGCGPEYTRPIPIVPPDPVYTRQAKAERVEGDAVVKCLLTKEGIATNCRILQGLPHMNEAILEAIAKARYKPATYDGKPIEMQYTFH